MTQPHFCPRCRNPLATDAPAGLCPGCLFELALEPSTAVPDAPNDSDPTAPAFDPAAAARYGLMARLIDPEEAPMIGGARNALVVR